MKRAFTMIELIFVIVILGILAAVAIPRFAATRDDANIAKSAMEIAIAIEEIGTYYTAKGSFGTSNLMTNIKFNVSNAATADTNLTGTPGAYYTINGVFDCIGFGTTTTDGNLTVYNIAGKTGICKDVQNVIAARDLNKTHVFGGKKVKY